MTLNFFFNPPFPTAVIIGMCATPLFYAVSKTEPKTSFMIGKGSANYTMSQGLIIVLNFSSDTSLWQPSKGQQTTIKDNLLLFMYSKKEVHSFLQLKKLLVGQEIQTTKRPNVSWCGHQCLWARKLAVLHTVWHLRFTPLQIPGIAPSLSVPPPQFRHW